MNTPHVDIDALAAELGITPAKAAQHIRTAIDAGFLRVVSQDDDTAVLEAVIPNASPKETR